MAPSTATKWARQLGLPAVEPSIVESQDDAWLLKSLKKAKDRASVEELADAADVSPKRVREAIGRLEESGYRVFEEEHEVVLRRVPSPSVNVHKALFKGKTYRFGIVSDTHLGSKHERLEELHMAYNVFKEEGITTVYHPGDLVCGCNVFPGQINTIHKHTYEDQVEYAVQNFPHIEGITTELIGGNHDLEGAWGKAGANPCLAVSHQRPDIEYIGDYNAVVEFPQGTRLMLLHPAGGMGYAMDYKARKLVEGFEGGTKPNALLVGHYHRVGWFLPRGVHVLFTGCFESGGDFGPRRGLPDPAVGFYLVTMKLADDGSIVSFLPEWRPFWAGRQVKQRKVA